MAHFSNFCIFETWPSTTPTSLWSRWSCSLWIDKIYQFYVGADEKHFYSTTPHSILINWAIICSNKSGKYPCNLNTPDPAAGLLHRFPIFWLCFAHRLRPIDTHLALYTILYNNSAKNRYAEPVLNKTKQISKIRD